MGKKKKKTDLSQLLKFVQLRLKYEKLTTKGVRYVEHEFGSKARPGFVEFVIQNISRTPNDEKTHYAYVPIGLIQLLQAGFGGKKVEIGHNDEVGDGKLLVTFWNPNPRSIQRILR